MKKLFNRLSELGIQNNLRFSSQELLHDSVIALDGIRGKLLVINGIGKDKYEETLIDLEELKSCSFKREYGSIKAGDLKKRKLAQLLNKISLLFEFRTQKEPMEVPFYQHSETGNMKVSEMEIKARRWGIVLSKMLRKEKTQ